MNTQLEHPTKAELSAFALGKLPEESSATIEHHLAECDDCSATLASVADDTLIGLLAAHENADVEEGGLIDVPPDDPARTAALNKNIVADLPADLADHPRYRVERLLGRGGMGDVYLAEHRLMERPVAIKVMKGRLMGRPDAVERFRREVKAAAHLKHEHIVTAYDAEQAGDLHVLVMEYVDGQDLATQVKSHGPLSVHEACEYARQAALGLAHAHARGMVHRDIKPHNLMLVDGQVKILDFGLAQLVETAAELPRSGARGTASSLTGAHSVLGTPDYIAPEQIHDAHAADHRADLYSLGATLFFLLTGRPPFAAGSATERIECHLSREPADIRDLRPEITEELAHVIRRLMAKRPGQRYQMAEMAAAALAPFCREPSRVLPAPPVASSRFGNWAIAPLLAAIVAGGGWGFWQIVVTIRDRDGNIVSRSNVPEGGQVTVGGAGQPSAEEPSTAVDEIARQANAFLQAALQGDAAAASALTAPGFPDGQIDDFRELGLERLAVERVWADAKAALAISQPVTVENPPGKQEGRLVITLEKQGGKWLVNDVDFEMDASLEEVKRFRDQHPNASERTKRAEPLPRGSSFHPGDPRPAGHPVPPDDQKVLATFGPDDEPITKDGVTPGDGGWMIEVEGDRFVRLFDVDSPGVDDCVLTYEAKLKTEDVGGRAYLEMWVRMPDGREAFSKGLSEPITGTTGWASYQIPFFLKEGEQPELVKLGVTVEGGGTVWIRDMELKSQPAHHGIWWAGESGLQRPLSTERFALRTREGYYLRAVKGGGDDVRADTKEPKTSEIFMFEWLDPEKSKVRLRTRDGYYVHPVSGGGENVDANEREPGTSEVFEVEWVDRKAGQLRLRTREGYYIHPVLGGGGDVDAKQQDPGSSEVFTLVPTTSA